MLLTRVHDRLLPTALAHQADTHSRHRLRTAQPRPTNAPSTPSPNRTDSPPDQNLTQDSGFAGPSFLGGGFEGDVVAERFKLSDVVASFGLGVDVAVVVVGAEVVEVGVWVGEEMPDDHQH